MATGDSCSSTVMKNCVQKSVGMEVSGVLPFSLQKLVLKHQMGRIPNQTARQAGLGLESMCSRARFCCQANCGTAGPELPQPSPRSQRGASRAEGHWDQLHRLDRVSHALVSRVRRKEPGSRFTGMFTVCVRIQPLPVTAKAVAQPSETSPSQPAHNGRLLRLGKRICRLPRPALVSVGLLQQNRRAHA